MNQKKLISISILLVIFFMGCSGGGSSSESNTEQQLSQGIWQGTYTTDTGIMFTSFSLVTTSGEVGMDLGNGVLFIGVCDVNGNKIEIDGGESVETSPIVEINGNISSSNSMNLTVTQGGYAMSQGDKFSFSYDDIYDRISSLSTLRGTWSGTNSFGGSPRTTTFNIDLNGEITGSHGVFTFSGQFSLIDSSVNEYEANLTIIGAPQYAAVGDYFGVATIIDTNVSSDALVLFIEKQSPYNERFCLRLKKN